MKLKIFNILKEIKISNFENKNESILRFLEKNKKLIINYILEDLDEHNRNLLLLSGFNKLETIDVSILNSKNNISLFTYYGTEDDEELYTIIISQYKFDNYRKIPNINLYYTIY